jgi:ubiquinone/menaquinone biosynthesis C-methylase UbiE
MIFANPIGAAYASGSFYDHSGQEFYLSPDKLRGDFSEARFRRELALFRKHCRSGKVLDVGCSSGAFLFQLRERFPAEYQVVGTDVSGAPLDYAESQGIEVLRGDFLMAPVPRESFDAVTFWAVLEHLAEPGRFLEKAFGVLKPGGACFVLVPNMESLAVRLLGKRYRYILPQHVNYFTRTTLQTLAEQWFGTRECRCTHFNPAVIWQDWRRGNSLPPSDANRAALLRKTTALKENHWLRPLQWVYHGVEATLGSMGLADNIAYVFVKAPQPAQRGNP